MALAHGFSVCSQLLQQIKLGSSQGPGPHCVFCLSPPLAWPPDLKGLAPSHHLDHNIRLPSPWRPPRSSSVGAPSHHPLDSLVFSALSQTDMPLSQYVHCHQNVCHQNESPMGSELSPVLFTAELRGPDLEPAFNDEVENRATSKARL